MSHSTPFVSLRGVHHTYTSASGDYKAVISKVHTTELEKSVKAQQPSEGNSIKQMHTVAKIRQSKECCIRLEQGNKKASLAVSCVVIYLRSSFV